MLRRLFGARKTDTRPMAIYAAIVAASRQTVFFTDLSVPDSLEGRFEVLVLHSWLIASHLGAGGETARAMSQEVFDLMFTDLDRSLREAGIGDLSVPKQIRRMAEAYYGRSTAYGAALAEGVPTDALAAVIGRNVFDGVSGAGTANQVLAMAHYTLAANMALSQCEEAELLEGQLPFPQAEDYVSDPGNGSVLNGFKGRGAGE